MSGTPDNECSRLIGVERAFLVAQRRDHPTHTAEAEPITVEVRGNDVEIVLDDDVSLTVDLRELLAAIQPQRQSIAA